MNWEHIKERIYYEDGSLRDIYVRDITIGDWEKWIDYIRQYPPLS